MYTGLSSPAVINLDATTGLLHKDKHVMHEALSENKNSLNVYFNKAHKNLIILTEG